MLAERMQRILEDATQPVPDLLRELTADLLAEWSHLGLRLQVLTGQLEAVARQDDTTRRQMTVRGVGPIIATALVVKQARPERFPSGRQFAAYFGAVPDRHSSGSTIRLGRMTKRGDSYRIITGRDAGRKVVPLQTLPGDGCSRHHAPT